MFQLIYYRLQCARVLVAKGGVCKLSGFGFPQEIIDRNAYQQVRTHLGVCVYGSCVVVCVISVCVCMIGVSVCVISVCVCVCDKCVCDACAYHMYVYIICNV